MATQDDEAFVLEGSTTYSYAQILDLLEQHSSIIITIPVLSLDALKSGLSVRKSRMTRKLKEQDIPVDEQKLYYTQVGEVDSAGWLTVRIDLKASSGVVVKDIKLLGDF